MNKNTFARLIQRCDRSHIGNMALEKDGKLIPLRKITISKDSKKIHFIAVDEKDTCCYYRNQFTQLETLATIREGYQWSFIISVNTGKCLKLHFSMEDGYSPYAYTDDVIRNYKDVSNSIPKHLVEYKGKTVLIKHRSDTAMYRVFSEEEDGNAYPVTDNFIIPDFDYSVYYDGTAPNIPCVRMHSNSNKGVFACAMGVCLITRKTIYTADGEYELEVV